MAVGDRLTSSLQESILTALCFNDDKGRIISGLLQPDHFEPPYRDIAERAIEYHQRYRKAPGAEHVDDLFDHVLEDPKNRQGPVYKRLLQGMYEQAKGLNVDYVMTRVEEFIRRQTYKQATLRAAARIQQGGDDFSDDVEAIWQDAMRVRTQIFDSGTRLGDKDRALRFLTNPVDALRTGIVELDKFQLGPTRKELGLFIAPRKRGKSWWLIHLGKMGLMQHQKVLHVSLEMSEERTIQRYYQSLFSVAKRDEKFKQTFFEFDELGRLSNFRREITSPRLALNDPRIKRKLRSHMEEWGTRLDDLVIKEFPTGSLTISKFKAYLDMLETVERFVPDLILFDYPDLCYIDPRNYRIALGKIFEDLRGIGVERNMAIEAVTQGNRASETASKTVGAQVSENISKVATCDRAITYSQTPDERTLGLARLFVDAARNDEDKFTVLVTQAYKVGQFALESARMPGNDYWDQVKAEVGTLSEEQPDHEDDDGDR